MREASKSHFLTEAFMDVLELLWLFLALTTLFLALWIVAIQGFDMYENAVQRCGEKGGACEELLMDPDSDIFGIMPSTLASAVMVAIVIVFVSDLQIGLVELSLACVSGVVSLHYVGLQLRLRRYCSICNYFHASNVALMSLSGALIWYGSTSLAVPDVLMAGIVFATVTAGLTLAANEREKRVDADMARDLYKAILTYEDHRELAALKVGTPAIPPQSSIIEISPDDSKDGPHAVLAISIGCSFCAEALGWAVENYHNLTEHWRLCILFVDSHEANPQSISFATVIARSCKAIPPAERFDYLKTAVLPFLKGQPTTARDLNKVPGTPDSLPALSVPVLPFAPAVIIDGVLLDEAINYPEQILALPLGKA